MVSHPLRVHTVPSDDPAGETTEITVVRIPADEGMRPLQDSHNIFLQRQQRIQLYIYNAATFFATFLPGSVPLPQWRFATDEILRTLVHLLIELQALEVAFPFYDIPPMVLITTIHAAVVCTNAAIASCPVLATPEVTAVLAELTTTLRRVFSAISPTHAPPLILQDSPVDSVPPYEISEASTSTSIIVVQQTPLDLLPTETPGSLWAMRQLRRQQRSLIKYLVAYFHGFIPSPVPISRLVFAAAEILRTLAPLPNLVLALEAECDHVMLAEIALAASNEVIKLIPALATTEVTTAIAALALALHRVTPTHTRRYHPALTICELDNIASQSSPQMLIEEIHPTATEPTPYVLTSDIVSDTAAAPEPAPDAAITSPPSPVTVSISSNASVPAALAAEPVYEPTIQTTQSVESNHDAFQTSDGGAAAEEMEIVGGDDLPPPGFSTPNVSNDALYRGVWGVANCAVIEGRNAAILDFPGYAVKSYRLSRDNLELVNAYGAVHVQFFTPIQQNEVRHNLNFMETTLASLDGHSETGPEYRADVIVGAVSFLDNVSKGAIPLNHASQVALVHYGNAICDMVVEAVTSLASELNKYKLGMQCVAGGCLAIGYVHLILTENIHLIQGEIGVMFRRLFDVVMGALGNLENGAAARPGQVMSILGSEAEFHACESLAFVSEAANSQSRVATLDSWVVESSSGYQRCSQEPANITANITALPLSRSSSGPTSGQATPMSESGGVAPASETFKPATCASAGNARSNSNRSNSRGRGGRGRGRGKSSHKRKH